MDVHFGYWMPLGSGGMVISSLPQRTDWTLEWNAQMAARAENSGFEDELPRFGETVIPLVRRERAKARTELWSSNGVLA
ncbi:hypothetical protein WMF38_09825 [Sorangium sp. So ce118]